MSRPGTGFWKAAQLVGGAGILAVVIWRLGTGPILDGLRSISAGPLLAAAGIAAVTTVCSAWRWSLVAQGLNIEIRLPAAIAAYYRSQFLNTALPGGVLGDVHRGVRHGRDVGDLGRGLRGVMWERFAGQVVQVVLALIALLVLPSPVRSFMPVVVALVAVSALAALLVIRFVPNSWTQTLSADVRDGLLARPAWPGITLASILIVAGHTATFLIAARTAGSRASLVTLLPLALLVLLAMVVPTNIGGWGPREGAAAWLFSAAGLGADRGVATATVYGVMVLVSSLPGAVVLIAARRRPQPRRRQTLQRSWEADVAAIPRQPVAVDGRAARLHG
jgi:glycosyltransferase 2 family protein